MDDFGNDYMTMYWWMHCVQYAASIATFGFCDDTMLDICMDYCIDYAAQDI